LSKSALGKGNWLPVQLKQEAQFVETHQKAPNNRVHSIINIA
jgi:hypothetical protein